jgi:hypothetical protein
VGTPRFASIWRPRKSAPYQWNLRRGIGNVPVSAIAPALLVSNSRSSARASLDQPPYLPRPEKQP